MAPKTTSQAFRITLGGSRVKEGAKHGKERSLGSDGEQIEKHMKKTPNKISQPITDRAGRETEKLRYEWETRRHESIEDGSDFLKDFLRCHFEEHLDYIRIVNNLTLDEIKMIGNEQSKALGVRQCRRLFNAPVLSDQIGFLLWCELRQGHNLDHNHEI
ncbi:hypothetical protein AAE478_007658 [Parahypoxylon ruwenzoriense]